MALSIQEVNSTSYVDVIALQIGLTRLQGEPADVFLDRLYQATANVRDHTYEGTVNELSFVMGLSLSTAITITNSDPTTLIVSSFGQVAITQGTVKVVIPTITIESDNYWVWRRLSDVVADINAKTTSTAVLNSGDGLAWRLGAQSSLNIVVAEPITSADMYLEHSGVVVGTERFSSSVPSYTLSSAGRLVFTNPPSADTKITYVYNLSPFQLAMSQLGVFSLTDATLKTYAAGPSGVLVHQLNEYTSDLLKQDPSYWGE